MLYGNKDFLGLKEIIKLHMVTDAAGSEKKGDVKESARTGLQVGLQEIPAH